MSKKTAVKNTAHNVSGGACPRDQQPANHSSPTQTGSAMYANSISPRDFFQKALVLSTVALIGLSAATSNADVPGLRVWTNVETRRVLRGAEAESTLAVELSAARNEWESFQILMRSDRPVRIVSLEAGDLQGPDGAVLSGNDARLFRQHQFHIQRPTMRNDNFKPGWYPDGL
ncbi:MAG: hypothetical protein U9N87_10670, partial [Planctomycetota bacterium]|nr:hypothetical protein [Planctomycetota bacterium]